MAYDHKQIAETALKCLRENPQLTLAAIANHLAVERHTVRRALLVVYGVTFRDLKRESFLERSSTLRRTTAQRSAKELSFALGFKTASGLSRLIRRARRQHVL